MARTFLFKKTCFSIDANNIYPFGEFPFAPLT